MEANELRDLVTKRTGLKGDELVCPREHSVMTPCVVRDGDMCMFDRVKDKRCVGCRADVINGRTRKT